MKLSLYRHFRLLPSQSHDCHFDRIINSILLNSLSQEPMNHIHALLAAQNIFPHSFIIWCRSGRPISAKMKIPFSLHNSGAPRPHYLIPFASLMLPTFLLHKFRYVHRRLYNFKPNDSIVPYQRALLRFQLFCEIFHQWVNSIGCVVSFPKNSYAWFKFNDKLEQDEGQTERTAIIETLKCRVSESRPSRSSWQCRFIEDVRLRRSDRSRTDAD